MLSSSFLSDKFAQALPYDEYLKTGTDEQRRRWQQVYDVAQLLAPQREMVEGFVRQMRILVVSGIWCGDCVQQVPLIQRVAEANPEKIDLRIVDRDAAADLSEQLRINAGNRVPAVLLLAEDFEFCALAGDRTVSRYRALALRQLGAACPTGIVGPDADEMAATLADWLGEIERVQLMLRLSARLRKKHGD
jgi:thioredoxin-like negative regulator of GroEL